jgi:hypothetical protein
MLTSRNRLRSRHLIGAVVTALIVVPGLAMAAAKPSVKSGYYASLVGVRSTDVEFHVRGTAHKIPDLALVCVPTDSSQATSTATIAVHMPALRIRNGSFSYSGPAKLTEAYFGAPKITTTTLSIHATHVNGPVHHYVFEGHHLQETTAFKGSASSPACASLPLHGKFTLFGPVPGE